MGNDIQESSQAKVAQTIAAVLRNRTLEDAAAELQITYRGLRKRIVKWPEIQKAIDSVVGEATDKLKVAAPKAAGVIVDSLDDRHLKFEAAKEVLDRVGVGQQKNQQTVNVLVMPSELMEKYAIAKTTSDSE